MTDDELIEAMARAIFSVIVEEAEFVPPKDDWKICIEEAKAALAVCKPAIMERCAQIGENAMRDKAGLVYGRIFAGAIRGMRE